MQKVIQNNQDERTDLQLMGIFILLSHQFFFLHCHVSVHETLCLCQLHRMVQFTFLFQSCCIHISLASISLVTLYF